MVVLSVHHLLGLPAEHITSLPLDGELYRAVLSLPSGPDCPVERPVLLLVVVAESPAGHQAAPLDDGHPGGAGVGLDLPHADQTQEVLSALRLGPGLAEGSPDGLEGTDHLLLHQTGYQGLLLTGVQFGEFVALRLGLISLAQGLRDGLYVGSDVNVLQTAVLLDSLGQDLGEGPNGVVGVKWWQFVREEEPVH